MTQSPYVPPAEPTVIYSPGGLSTTAHLVNVIIVLLTCGLWLPIYVIMILTAPKRRIQVVAPPGTPPEQVWAIRRQALGIARADEARLTPEERRRSNRKVLVAFSILLGAIVVIVSIINLAT